MSEKIAKLKRDFAELGALTKKILKHEKRADERHQDWSEDALHLLDRWERITKELLDDNEYILGRWEQTIKDAMQTNDLLGCALQDQKDTLRKFDEVVDGWEQDLYRIKQVVAVLARRLKDPELTPRESSLIGEIQDALSASKPKMTVKVTLGTSVDQVHGDGSKTTVPRVTAKTIKIH